MARINLKELTIKKAEKHLQNKDFSALELTEAYLNSIKSKDREIKAYLNVFWEKAINEAKEADKKIANGASSHLLGIPASIKDNILIKGEKCTAASKMLDNFIAPYDATVIKKLKKEGVVFLGKTNLDEFAMGSSTENSAFQTTRNPYDKERVPGGSSGGSAASVSADEALFSLGSDTGGSIRQPASFCGVVGFKPTYGAVSRYGLIAFSSSLDQIGPLAKTVEDAEIIFNAIRGRDEMDSTTIADNNFDFSQSQKKEIRVGIIKELSENLDKEVKNKTEEAIKKISSLGNVKFKEKAMPSLKYSLACYYIIAPSEASSNLARYDGVRYGNRNDRGGNLMENYLTARENFGREVKRRIMIGTYALSAGYFDAYYIKAQELRKKIYNDFLSIFNEIDFIISPTSPTLPFKVGERKDPLQMYLSDILTIPANLAGLPAISLPIGKAKGLPVGLQIIANRGEEEKLFNFAKQIEKTYA